LSGCGRKKSAAFAKRLPLYIRNSEPDGNSEANPVIHSTKFDSKKAQPLLKGFRFTFGIRSNKGSA
jgi:hypothetical protein